MHFAHHPQIPTRTSRPVTELMRWILFSIRFSRQTPLFCKSFSIFRLLLRSCSTTTCLQNAIHAYVLQSLTGLSPLRVSPCSKALSLHYWAFYEMVTLFSSPRTAFQSCMIPSPVHSKLTRGHLTPRRHHHISSPKAI